MRRRYVVLGMSAVLALCLAVPALGGPSNPIASSAGSAKSLAKKALNKANAAQNSANQAQNTASQAQSTANGADTAAKNAQTTADAATTAAAAAQTAAEAAQTTADGKISGGSTSFGDISGDNSNSPKTVTGTCPNGKLLSGGYFTAGITNDITYTQNFPYGNIWQVEAEEIAANAGTWQIQAVVQCGS